MQLFYISDIEGFGHYHLNENESKHCIKSLRCKKGDALFITNGKGTLFSALVEDENSKKTSVLITEIIRKQEKTSPYIHIAIAPTKNMSRFEWFLEKSTEIGISEITPIICNNSERRKLNHDRAEKIIISAMKQSGQVQLPKLNEITSFKEFIVDDIDMDKYIAYCDGDERKLLSKKCKDGNDTLVLIGPEGDFAKEEVVMAIDNAYETVSLGNNILRTETAAVLACSTINIVNL